MKIERNQEEGNEETWCHGRTKKRLLPEDPLPMSEVELVIVFFVLVPGAFARPPGGTGGGLPPPVPAPVFSQFSSDSIYAWGANL